MINPSLRRVPLFPNSFPAKTSESHHSSLYLPLITWLICLVSNIWGLLQRKAGAKPCWRTSPCFDL